MAADNEKQHDKALQPLLFLGLTLVVFVVSGATRPLWTLMMDLRHTSRLTRSAHASNPSWLLWISHRNFIGLICFGSVSRGEQWILCF